jgi:hypothetical protein
MKRIKYLTQEQVDKIATHFIAAFGSCHAPTKKICGTITQNEHGYKFNTSSVSIMLYTENFWIYWETEAKRQNAYIELYADKKL